MDELVNTNLSFFELLSLFISFFEFLVKMKKLVWVRKAFKFIQDYINLSLIFFICLSCPLGYFLVTSNTNAIVFILGERDPAEFGLNSILTPSGEICSTDEQIISCYVDYWKFLSTKLADKWDWRIFGWKCPSL